MLGSGSGGFCVVGRGSSVGGWGSLYGGEGIQCWGLGVPVWWRGDPVLGLGVPVWWRGDPVFGAGGPYMVGRGSSAEGQSYGGPSMLGGIPVCCGALHRGLCMVGRGSSVGGWGSLYGGEGIQCWGLGVPVWWGGDPVPRARVTGVLVCWEESLYVAGPAQGCSLFVNRQTGTPLGTHPLSREDRHQR